MLKSARPRKPCAGSEELDPYGGLFLGSARVDVTLHDVEHHEEVRDVGSAGVADMSHGVDNGRQLVERQENVGRLDKRSSAVEEFKGSKREP